MRRVAIFLAFGILLLFRSLPSAAQQWIKEPSNGSADRRWTIYGEVSIDPGDGILDPHSAIPTCKDRRESSGERSSFLVMQALQANIFDSLKPFATSGGNLTGSVVGTLQTEVSKFGEEIAGDPGKKEAIRSVQDFTTFLNQVGVSRRSTACGTITLILPVGARDIGGPTYAVAEDNMKYTPCANGQSEATLCPAGNLGFLQYRDPRSSAYVFVVKNWSPNRTRHVRISMLFTPPLNYVPPDDSATPEKNSPPQN